MMKTAELRECLRRLNMSPGQLSKLLGKKLDTIDDQTARCIRALVLKPEVSRVVAEVRAVFPEATLVAVRRIEDGKEEG